jgi:histone deacetylase complex regulatory component SIN3
MSATKLGNALDYLDLLKKQTSPQTYNDFLSVMKDFKMGMYELFEVLFIVFILTW